MKNQPTPPDREVLTGLIERVTYQNAENGCYPRAILLSAASAARSPASQAPPTVPHKVSCAASPANQRRSRSGSASALRAHCPPANAAIATSPSSARPAPSLPATSTKQSFDPDRLASSAAVRGLVAFSNTRLS